MANKPVTIARATARVTPHGVRLIGADTDAASGRIIALAAANNGKRLRCEKREHPARCEACESCKRYDDRSSVLAFCKALVRMALAGTIVPAENLASARTALASGKLPGVVIATDVITAGTSVSAVNMALDRDAKAFGADGFTIRQMDHPGGVFVYIGKPK